MLPIPGLKRLGSGPNTEIYDKVLAGSPQGMNEVLFFSLLPKIRGGIVGAVVCHLENLVVT